MATYPIWQDRSVSIPNGNLFRISGGTGPNGESGTFYQGLAVAPASGSGGNAAVFYNRICAARMLYGAPSFSSNTKTAVCTAQSFTIQRSADDGATWTTVATVSFRPDWSYLSDSNAVKSRPINDHFHPQMRLFFSVIEWSINTTQAWYDVGNGHVNTSYSQMNVAAGTTATYVIPNTAAKSVGIGTLTWRTPRPCAPGALYYRNAFGGWDSFLIEGAIVPVEDTQRWTRRIAINNSGLPGTVLRGEQNYVNETTHRWTLTTGGMTDAQARAFAQHILPSGDVWLHIFDGDTIVPVIIDTAQQEVRSYKTNGRRPVTFSLDCHLAQERISM